MDAHPGRRSASCASPRSDLVRTLQAATAEPGPDGSPAPPPYRRSPVAVVAVDRWNEQARLFRRQSGPLGTVIYHTAFVHLPFLITGDADQTNGFFTPARDLLGIGAPRVRPDEPLLVDGQMALTYDAPLSPSARPRRTPPRASASPPPDRTTCRAAAPSAPADRPPRPGANRPRLCSAAAPARQGGSSGLRRRGTVGTAPSTAHDLDGQGRRFTRRGVGVGASTVSMPVTGMPRRSAPCSSLPRKGGGDQNATAVARAAYNERATAPRAPAERETAERDAIARGVLLARC
ncbi:Uncharacterised protein [Mycobacterium tuberculosis]|nr:Uncharacterised protein [Mycobacterium tuberculosis]